MAVAFDSEAPDLSFSPPAGPTMTEKRERDTWPAGGEGKVGRSLVTNLPLEGPGRQRSVSFPFVIAAAWGRSLHVSEHSINHVDPRACGPSLPRIDPQLMMSAREKASSKGTAGPVHPRPSHEQPKRPTND
eukprot:gnl/TRDRNA2_/TRDRNA2_177610_c0_seq3.p2 gnl/TRDRNA2_/TRDRNA2_177610_c0~~gnl/TRDRNA2_/TRDRNA2_177610_c0_seq3.p2  ORF type:complete len:131 (-),score=2.12 gnl/TRDRNA2_/TRDRNA2_177610_c0_seq3:773-1165(-)